ncbi:hypothetical protein FGO68_gene8764 [Halteria grandinella]|uniref:Protein kinase domain-containing protein n=1 Tax=Halteria grandinella TaxID=5974 RepID=A0A8J8T2L9_HALGN|nr:hypothetical protein FGO68_gene8764 [Halteria grandinella]
MMIEITFQTLQAAFVAPMNFIVYPDPSFADSLSSLRESTEVLIAQANSLLDDLLPTKSLRLMLLEELTQAHQVVQDCERDGRALPRQATMQEFDDWGNLVEREVSLVTSTDIQRALKVREVLEVLMVIVSERKAESLRAFIRRHAHMFEPEQLLGIEELFERHLGANKPYVIYKLKQVPQLQIMILGYLDFRQFVSLFLWTFTAKSRAFYLKYICKLDTRLLVRTTNSRGVEEAMERHRVEIECALFDKVECVQYASLPTFPSQTDIYVFKRKPSLLGGQCVKQHDYTTGDRFLHTLLTYYPSSVPFNMHICHKLLEAYDRLFSIMHLDLSLSNLAVTIGEGSVEFYIRESQGQGRDPVVRREEPMKVIRGYYSNKVYNEHPDMIFIAPETLQVFNMYTPIPLTHQQDIYSLGVMMFIVITGGLVP